MLSLETCQKLRDAGWPQERTPYYRIFLAAENIDCDDDHWDKGSPTTACFLSSVPDNLNFIACPTLEELLEAIATDAVVEVSSGWPNETWLIEVIFHGETISITNNELPEAAAALWLKLKEVA